MGQEIALLRIAILMRIRTLNLPEIFLEHFCHVAGATCRLQGCPEMKFVFSFKRAGASICSATRVWPLMAASSKWSTRSPCVESIMSASVVVAATSSGPGENRNPAMIAETRNFACSRPASGP
jgi:hypothetical protein